MAGRKFYVVWKGHVPGVYESWAECQTQIEGVKGAKYRSYLSEEEARAAYTEGYKAKPSLIQKPIPPCGDPILESIAVDASCLGNPGIMEYRGVYVRSGLELFRIGPFQDGTNNVGEFLALVHGLAFLKQRGSKLPVYADSLTSIAWVRKKKAKTTLDRTKRNDEIFNLIERAEKWLRENTYENQVLKWETPYWGEIPADFGRK